MPPPPPSSSAAASSASAAAASAPPPPMASSPEPSAVASSSAASAPSQEPSAKRVTVPRCAAWFALDSISAVEKRLLPEFFEHDARHKAQFPPGAKLPSSKTPQIYLKYRNYMVHAYRQQPHVYLTATACRRNLAGDACAIMRVHEFLTHWGIINYDVPPHAMPPALHANYALRDAAAAKPLATVVHDAKASSAPSGTPRPSSSPTSSASDAAAAASTAALCERCGAGDVAFELSAEAKRKLGAPEPSASAYAKRDLPLQGFCLRPGSGVCDDCFLARSFPDGVDAGDFVKVPPKAAWTADEDALLLDAVSSASSGSTGSQQEACDWNQIAGKVKTKTAEECVVRFLELPLLARVTGETADAATRAPTFAYAETVNAAVVDMAALVRDVDPFVAKAAARAAIQAIKDLHKLPPREVAAPPEPEKDTAVGGDSVKTEETTSTTTTSTMAADDHRTTSNSTTDASGDVEMSNGESHASDAKADVDAAAAAVVAAGEAAGIVTIKTEPLAAVDSTSTSSAPVLAAATNGSGSGSDDVEMAETQTSTTATTTSPVTKETLAVVQEASHATAAALVAARADRVAAETARGPVRDLVTQLLQNELEQLELKMRQLSVLEKALAADKESLARDRHALYMERLAFAQRKLHGGSAAAL